MVYLNRQWTVIGKVFSHRLWHIHCWFGSGIILDELLKRNWFITIFKLDK
jgi:hypothetical protein